MQQKQNNTLNMYIAVLKYLENNKDNWQANSLIAKAVYNFQTPVASIKKIASQQSANLNKRIFKEDVSKKILINVTHKLALRLKNYALNTDNIMLKQAVDFSKNELEAGNATEVLQWCKDIIDKAKAVKNAPSEYKITDELIAKVETAVTDAAPKVDVYNNEVNEALEDLFNESTKYLHLLDDLIEADADDDTSNFMLTYFIMRRVNFNERNISD